MTIMEFPKTWEEYEEQWKIKDSDEVYSNGIDFIPCFRVRQWLEHIESSGNGEIELVYKYLLAKEEDNILMGFFYRRIYNDIFDLIRNYRTLRKWRMKNERIKKMEL